MITGSRALVPELREVPGLEFDVMPIPSIDGQATVGEITGLCVSKTPRARPPPPTSWSTPPARGRRARWPVRATSSRPTRRSPSPTTSCSPAEHAALRHRLQRVGRPHGRPAAARHLGRARGRRRALPPTSSSTPGRPSTCRSSAQQIDAASQPILNPEEQTPHTVDGTARARRTPLVRRLLGPGSGRSASAASTASAITGATRRTCQARAPRSRSADRDRPGERLGLAGRGRGPQHPAEEVGGQQVLGRQRRAARPVAAIASRASCSRRAATGSFSAQARGGGGPSARGVRVGSWASGRSRTCAAPRPSGRRSGRPRGRRSPWSP